ncbi:hypothetical protein LTS08_006320 [Lithohypha guttulata]|nr:hypothetical protein LTS08_006320 [Lithohypha guttulata]
MAEDPTLAAAKAAQAEAKSTKRENVISTKPNAQYMLARIDVLTQIFVFRLSNLLESADPAGPEKDTPEQPPSLVDTANHQLLADTVTMALIRAAEELMVLTRTMKELWLLGNLDTLVSDQTNKEREKTENLKKDEDAVVRGLHEWFKQNGDKLSRPLDEQKGEEDTKMVND